MQSSRLRDLLLEGAAPLIDKVVESTGVAASDTEPLRALAELSLDFLFALAPHEEPEELPSDIEDIVAGLAPAGIDVSAEALTATVREAFFFAVEFTTQRASAAGISPSAVQHWIGAMHRFESLVLDALVRGGNAARFARERRWRYAQSRLLASVVRDPAIESAAAQSLFAAGTDADQIDIPPLPAWLEDAAAEVVPILVRGRSIKAGLPTPATLPDLSQLPQPCLAALGEPESILVMPTAAVPAAVASVVAAFDQSDVVVGLAVRVDEVARSLMWCRRAVALRENVCVDLPPNGTSPAVLDCSDIVTELIIGADEALLRHVAHTILRPFDGLGDHRRAILLETLLAWARRPNAGIPVIARELDRHPQTVRYRMRQLRDVVGDVLDDERQMLLVNIVLSLHAKPRISPQLRTPHAEETARSRHA